MMAYIILGVIAIAIIAGVIGAFSQVAQTSDRFVRPNTNVIGVVIFIVAILFNMMSAVPPWLVAVVFVFLVLAILVGIGVIGQERQSGLVRPVNSTRSRYYLERNVESNIRARLNALKEAHIYLAPYNDIWKNLRLSNKYVMLTLGADGSTIIGEEKVSPYRQVRITGSKIHQADDLWNMFCKYFSYNKSYDGVIEDCERYQTYYMESISREKAAILEEQGSLVAPAQKQNTKPKKPKVDINNCSEVELTELPGISIVHAKKIIKKREEIGGFKKIDDLFLYLHLKPHMINQLRDLVKVEEMRGYIHKKLNEERSVDF